MSVTLYCLYISDNFANRCRLNRFFDFNHLLQFFNEYNSILQIIYLKISLTMILIISFKINIQYSQNIAIFLDYLKF